MTLTFEQWQIEIKNNLSMLIDNASRIKNKGSEISKPDINRLYKMVKALDQMYENLGGIKN
jgi:hypothetical protein